MLRFTSDDYPQTGLVASSISETAPSFAGPDVSFTGLRKYYCVSYVDLVGSTKIASQLTEGQISTYYGIFLNSVANIAKNFGAKVIKNAGDCLIYYFPKTSIQTNMPAFKEVIECAMTVLDARQMINHELFSKNLPAISYRISADYGKLEMVKTTSSRSKDFFGSTMNLCAKMNAKAEPNTVVIGDTLYKIVCSLKHYHFRKVGSYALDSDRSYAIYSVSATRRLTSRFSETLQAKRALKQIGK